MRRKKLDPKNGFDDWRDEVLNMVLDMAVGLYGWNMSDLASEADLAVSTVWNLMNHVTKEPRARTIYKLTKAVGLWMSVIEEVKIKHRKAG